MEETKKLMESIWWHVLDTIFPESCLGCHIRGESLCDNCIVKIHLAERRTDSDIYAAYDYRDPLIKRVIWDLKYHNRSNLGGKLGKLLYEYMIEEIADLNTYCSGKPIIVIPVPISHHRARTRGYNQAEIIARGFINSSSDNIFEFRDDIVWKKIDTKPQARISNRTKRLHNIKNVFEIKNNEAVLGRTIIVVDDVTTTGGTINEIIKILKKSGAKKVVGFAVAH